MKEETWITELGWKHKEACADGRSCICEIGSIKDRFVLKKEIKPCGNCHKDHEGRTLCDIADWEEEVKHFFGDNFGGLSEEVDMGTLIAFIKSRFIKKSKMEEMIVEEINISRTEGVPTSRLTSLFNKIKNIA